LTSKCWLALTSLLSPDEPHFPPSSLPPALLFPPFFPAFLSLVSLRPAPQIFAFLPRFIRWARPPHSSRPPLLLPPPPTVLTDLPTVPAAPVKSVQRYSRTSSFLCLPPLDCNQTPLSKMGSRSLIPPILRSPSLPVPRSPPYPAKSEVHFMCTARGRIPLPHSRRNPPPTNPPFCRTGSTVRMQFYAKDSDLLASKNTGSVFLRGRKIYSVVRPVPNPNQFPSMLQSITFPLTPHRSNDDSSARLLIPFVLPSAVVHQSPETEILTSSPPPRQSLLHGLCTDPRLLLLPLPWGLLRTPLPFKAE